MPPFSSRRVLRAKPIVRAWLLGSILAWATPFTALPATAIDIEGEWYVLVHFEESSASDSETPSVVDYRDFVWRFAREGDGLRWTVVRGVGFRDDTGRSESIRGASARLRHAWWPSAAQLAEIRGGLAADEQTARTKTLRRRTGDRFVSGGTARAGSASAVSYGEVWSVSKLEGEPVFEHSATLASGRSDTLEGQTRFEADQVAADAGRIEGRYARDRAERGRFVMWKKGVRAPDDAAFASRAADHPLLGPGGRARSQVAELEAKLARARTEEGREDAALRGEIRADLERLVEESYTRRGVALRPHRAEVDARVSELERLCVVEGLSLVEAEWRLVTEDAAR